MPRYDAHYLVNPDAAVCPIVGVAIDTTQQESDWHVHRRTQLLYQSEGALTVQTSERVGHLAPMQALWLPAGELHRVTIRRRSSHRSLFFDPGIYRDLPPAPVIVEVGPLMRELIVRVTQWSADSALSDAQARLVSTLLDELRAAPVASLHLPMPRDRRLALIANALLDDPSISATLDEWAGQAGATSRTLARLFLRETGLTYAQWRTQCRLLVAQALLAEGASVTAAAHAVGYASDSAFIAMYRRLYGVSPGRRRSISAG